MLGPVCPQRIIFLGWGYSVAPDMFLVAGAGSNLKQSWAININQPWMKKHLGTKWSQPTRIRWIESEMLGFPGILQRLAARLGTEWDPLKWQFVTVIRLDYTTKSQNKETTVLLVMISANMLFNFDILQFLHMPHEPPKLSGKSSWSGGEHWACFLTSPARYCLLQDSSVMDYENILFSFKHFGTRHPSWIKETISDRLHTRDKAWRKRVFLACGLFSLVLSRRSITSHVLKTEATMYHGQLTNSFSTRNAHLLALARGEKPLVTHSLYRFVYTLLSINKHYTSVVTFYSYLFRLIHANISSLPDCLKQQQCLNNQQKRWDWI